jgi:hypothetical protein
MIVIGVIAGVYIYNQMKNKDPKAGAWGHLERRKKRINPTTCRCYSDYNMGYAHISCPTNISCDDCCRNVNSNWRI